MTNLELLKLNYDVAVVQYKAARKERDKFVDSDDLFALRYLTTASLEMQNAEREMDEAEVCFLLEEANEKLEENPEIQCCRAEQKKYVIAAEELISAQRGLILAWNKYQEVGAEEAWSQYKAQNLTLKNAAHNYQRAMEDYVDAWEKAKEERIV